MATSWSKPTTCAAACSPRLRECGIESNTIVIFSSDNGPEFYAYARDEKYDHWSAAPFRGLKRDMYEGGHHVPFLLKWPGVTKPGAVTDALISQVDVMATLAELTNFELPRDAAADSHDFLPWLKGETRHHRDPRWFTTPVPRNTPSAPATGCWWMPSRCRAPTAAGVGEETQATAGRRPPVELYNLKDDIGQRHNLPPSSRKKYPSCRH